MSSSTPDSDAARANGDSTATGSPRSRGCGLVVAVSWLRSRGCGLVVAVSWLRSRGCGLGPLPYGEGNRPVRNSPGRARRGFFCDGTDTVGDLPPVRRDPVR
ncbi:MAG: hypothetical protein GEV11_07845 [Streptosporangiales bacterium]|nr:hypothetical protein [Streptosporangiales bacterium]